jgi:DNA-binding NarL/FixJ family response regulator
MWWWVLNIITVRDENIKIIIATGYKSFAEVIENKLLNSAGIKLLSLTYTGEKLLNLLPELKPDVLVIEKLVQGISQSELIGTSIREFPQIPIIALAGRNDKKHLIEMLQCGAKGYLLNKRVIYEITSAVRAVHNRHTYFCQHTTDHIRRLIERGNLPFKYEPLEREISLTGNETEIIKLICSGYTNIDIAVHLGCSKRTVEGIREIIYKKTGTKNSASAVVYAMRHGIFK